MLASVFNGVFIIGVPAEIHYYGPRYLYNFFGSLGAMTIVAIFFIPKYHAMALTSAYQVGRIRECFVAVSFFYINCYRI